MVGLANGLAVVFDLLNEALRVSLVEPFLREVLVARVEGGLAAGALVDVSDEVIRNEDGRHGKALADDL